MSRGIRREVAVERIGDDGMAVFRDCLASAWEKWTEHFRPFIPTPSSRGLANILHELIIEEARQRFGNIPGVNIRDNVLGGRFLLELRDARLIVQFKKLTQDFVTVNNPTPASLTFDRQQPIDDFPTWPRLTVGYQLSAYGTSLEMYLAYIIGDECIWYHNLESAESSIMLEFPDLVGPSAADLEQAEEERQRTAENDDENRATGDDGA